MRLAPLSNLLRPLSKKVSSLLRSLSKTSTYTLILKRPNACFLLVAESVLEFVESYKYLGLWLDPSLSFSTHIHKLQATVKARLAFLFRNKASFTRAAKHTLVKMTVLPALDYGDIIYKMASKAALHKLDVVHHSAIRFATDAPFETHHCDLYKMVDWTSLDTRRLHHWHHFIYKTILGKTPSYLSSLLHSRHSSYSTRSCELIKLTAPNSNSAFGEKSFHFAAANDWNNLQSSFKLIALISQTAFKEKLHERVVDPPCICPR